MPNQTNSGAKQPEPLLGEALTRREREVLGLLAQGLSGPEIAEQLTLGLSSVKSHIQHLYGKLGVNSKRQAVARARELGLLQPAAAAMAATATAAAPGPMHNLPPQLTRLFGRENDKGEIRRLLRSGEAETTRLLTLIGPGGSGKTRLALAVAGELVQAYAGGAWLVELAPLADAGLLDQTIALALGLREEASRPVRATVTTFLRAKQLLLVLDNCEHLIDACARLAGALLLACPRLTILATSREALGIEGERVWPVLGLEVPPAAPGLDGASETPSEFAAVQLFCERARAVRPSFSLTAQNTSSVVQVCQRLDGLPLAIELAAARVSLLPVEQIAALLDDRFRILTSGSRIALPRHQTLLAAIEWSYHLLSEPERLLLRRLSVFAGGWALEAAEEVCVGTPGGEHDPQAGANKAAAPAASVLDSLGRLTAKSLVVSDATPGSAARFHLLETIRSYARQKLDESGEAAAVGRRHFDYFLALAERAEPELHGRDQVSWFDRLDTELDNLRAALEWAAHGGDPAAGLRMASALHRFWDARGYWQEGYRQLKQFLTDKGPPQPSLVRALALARAAELALALGKFEDSTASARESLALARGLGPAGLVSAGYALVALFWLAFWHYAPEAEQFLQESLLMFDARGNDLGRALALQANSRWAIYSSDYSGAKRLAQESLELFERAGDKSGAAECLALLGTVARRLGEYGRAQELAETALAYFRQLRDQGSSSETLRDLGDAYNHLGQYEQAMAAAAESVALMRSVGGAWRIPKLLNDQSQIATRYGDYEQAARLLEESRRLAIELGQDGVAAGDDMDLGGIARARGDPARARGQIEAALSHFREAGVTEDIVYNEPELGKVYRDLGEYQQAAALITRSLDWFRSHGNLPETASLLLLLGGVARRQGDHPRARALLEECLSMCLKLDLRPLMATCLAELAYLLGDVARAEGSLPEAEKAARMLGASEALCQATTLPVPPADQADLAAYQGTVMILNALLGKERLSAAHAEGRGMSVGEAAAYALAALPSESEQGDSR